MNPRAGCSLAAVVLLASCAGLTWQDSGLPGALVEGNRRPNIVRSCAAMSLAIADSKYCEWAFVDHEGRRLDLDDKVVAVIDAYLANVSSLSSFATKYVGRPPYRLYLLTISPIVVMAVPIEKGERRSPYFGCGDRLKDGCLDSKKLQIPYRFLERPEVQPGSFWFSPDLRTLEQQIANGAQNVVIPLGFVPARPEIRRKELGSASQFSMMPLGFSVPVTMPPNSALVNDAYASALRASFSASQRER